MQKTVVVYDLEYTAWEGSNEHGWSAPNEYREIVQIGAVCIDAETFEEQDAISIFIQPKRNPILSQYFISLTGITQETLTAQGMPFHEGITRFAAWAQDRCMYAWGSDGDVIQENCVLYGESCPFSTGQLCSIKPFFIAQGIDAHAYMSSTILEAFGKKSPYVGHDGLNDARSIVLALAELTKLSRVRV